MNNTTYAVDLAKQVFQVHWVEVATGEIRRKALTRTEVNAFFAGREPGLIVMEACGSAHHWGRVLTGMGHQVKLIAAQFVRPFVKTNKTDAADAEELMSGRKPHTPVLGHIGRTIVQCMDAHATPRPRSGMRTALPTLMRGRAELRHGRCLADSRP